MLSSPVLQNLVSDLSEVRSSSLSSEKVIADLHFVSVPIFIFNSAFEFIRARILCNLGRDLSRSDIECY